MDQALLTSGDPEPKKDSSGSEFSQTLGTIAKELDPDLDSEDN